MIEEEDLPADAEQEETPDPLAEVAEADRERLNAYLETERTRLAAEAKAEAEAALKEHKAAVGQRLKERVRDYAGIEFDENERPVLKDPNRVAGLLMGSQPQKPAEDPRPDPVYDPDGFIAWSERRAEAKAEEKYKPLADRLDRLEGQWVSQRVEGASTQAAEALGTYGLGQWAEHPGFAQAYRANLALLPPQAIGTPDAARMAAMAAVATLDPAQLPKSRQTPPQDPGTGRFVPNGARAGLSQAQPPRGFSSQRPSSGFTAEFSAEAEQAGMTPEEYQAMMNPDTAWAYAEANGRGRR